ncbi:dihydromonapterin reductase [Ferrimonas balearica]|uniref:dihydromonapterin reductase n=1 Tax=Ferrimonas balearica TaxID=44012 RepID=UPI001C99C7A7|nr:dihydromonapterin reductase [Ferrimonas balearica]MBY5991197.1 dihydromonapterin reductase [Ferrimonas balearica]
MSAPVLITGVGKRIGLHLALRFLEQGVPVIGTFRREREALSGLAAEGANLYPCDFAQPEQLSSLIATLRDEHPALRAVIHNASDWLPDGAEADEAVLERMMAVHVAAPYRLNRALEAALTRGAAPSADIIHLTDYVAESGSAKHIAYAASKAALANMTLSFARKLAPAIKVNAIAPALIRFNPEDSAEYRAKALDKALLAKEGGEEEVWQAVQYLMQSGYVTGRTLHLDGGRPLR